MVEVSEQCVTSGGLRLFTERFGDPSDPAVLLVMGTSSQGIGWPDELVETLVAGGRQVVRFDHRDTGRSDCVDFASEPYTISEMTADTLAVLDGWGIDAAHVVGASLGGTIAQLLAVHHPERVRGLTAIMTSPMGHDSGPAWERAMAGLEPDPDDLPAPSPEFLQRLMSTVTVPRETREDRIAASLEVLRLLHGDGLPFDEPVARRYAEEAHDRATNPAAANNHDLAGRTRTDDRQAPLSSVGVPTLVIHGSKDPLLPFCRTGKRWLRPFRGRACT
ncbi:MAG TPA: alpha/beta hydrolase [Actinopolymorphaceae bacterium]